MQLATLLIGLISATALWSGVQALNQQARNSYDRAAATFGGARTASLVGGNGAPFAQQLFVDLRRAGWPVSPVLEGRLQIGGRSFRRCFDLCRPSTNIIPSLDACYQAITQNRLCRGYQRPASFSPAKMASAPKRMPAMKCKIRCAQV